jgi:ParB family transcriptional regulator, chromosome partitioning protein
MEIIFKNIEELLNYENNARTHSDDQIDQIASSIREFGFNDVIEVGPDNVIISGHARVEAAKRLGLKKLPVVVHKHLDGSKRDAYVLAANKIAMNSGWDYDLLKDCLSELTEEEQKLTGFSEDELSDLLYEEFISPTLVDEDDCPEPKKEIECPSCGHKF